MLDHISTIEQLEFEAKRIDDFLNITCSEDPNEAIVRGNDLVVYIARTGKMLADAKYWQDESIQTNTLLCNEAYKSMPPMVRKRLIESMCQRQNYIVTWVDRLNRAATHQCEWLRTVISKAKAEYQQSKGF